MKKKEEFRIFLSGRKRQNQNIEWIQDPYKTTNNVFYAKQ